MIKDLIVSSGRKLLDIATIFYLILVSAVFVGLCVNGRCFYALFGCGFAILVYIIFVFALYLLVSIHDTLQSIKAELSSVCAELKDSHRNSIGY